MMSGSVFEGQEQYESSDVLFIILVDESQPPGPAPSPPTHLCPGAWPRVPPTGSTPHN